MRIAILIMALGLTGCAVAWGKAYKVEFASPSSITINFDPSLTNMGRVQGVAQEHCAKYGKNAVPGEHQNSHWGLRTTSFVCS